MLLVLYEANQESPYGTILTAGEIRERLDLPYQRFPSGNVNALTQGVLDHLKQEKTVRKNSILVDVAGGNDVW